MSAADLKEAGNTAFRAGQFSRAAELYGQAEQADPTSALYPSNLSAALFEQGKYLGTIDAISRCYANLSDETTKQKLTPKLTTRLLKAFCYGVRNNTISLQDITTHRAVLRDFSACAESGTTDRDMKQNWLAWKRVEGEFRRVKDSEREALSRLASIPMVKTCSRPEPEFFVVGHDRPMSLVQKWQYHSQGTTGNLLDLNSIPDTQLSDFSFFFGGVGDARHPLRTLLDLGLLYRDLKEDRRKLLRFHLTLNDINAHALARDLCLFSLLLQLKGATDDMSKEELRMTILHLWLGIIMPPYCFIRLKETLQSLRTKLGTEPCQIPDWLFVNPSSIGPIVASLNYWDTELKDVSAGQLIEQRLRDQYPESDKKNAILSAEKAFFEGVYTFAPPAALRSSLYSGDLTRLWEARRKPGAARVDINKLQARAYREVKTTWKPNITHFSRFRNDYRPNQPPAFDGVGDAGFDMFEDVAQIDTLNRDLGLYAQMQKEVDPDCPSYSIVSVYLDAIIQTLETLRESIKIEFLLGDYNRELTKMLVGDDIERPKEFPRKFTRIWLSNIPDYTGGSLPIATIAMETLQKNEYSSIAANNLLNSGNWRKDYELYFGDRVVSKLNSAGILEYAHGLGARPIPFEQLPPREDLKVWLTRILLSIITPGTASTDNRRLIYPHTLAIFIWLLLRLQKLGYPSHWLSEYLQSVIDDDLTSRVVPHLGARPSRGTRLGPNRHLNLHPWRLELETILALAYEALPFPIQLPNDFALDHTAIASYEAPVPAFNEHTLQMACGYDPSFFLVFFKVGNEARLTNTEAPLSELLEGRLNIPKEEVYVISAVDRLSIETPTLRWRMSKLRVQAMQREKWKLMLYRQDVKEFCAHSLFY
ncbi:hypothetical protein VNI00_002547 [Paramarasmius palmivorus]|uniref:DUF4470 domain-containing protein n=1 Tax=Paramarasmius palmivorus TaxID=297713 RepID=A0AAW0DXQ2_9AGAR